MEALKLPPVVPETLLLLAIIGATVGAIATVGGYLTTKLAESIGGTVKIFPEVKK